MCKHPEPTHWRYGGACAIPDCSCESFANHDSAEDSEPTNPTPDSTESTTDSVESSPALDDVVIPGPTVSVAEVAEQIPSSMNES